MARNIRTYVRPFDLHEHKDSKLYHKATLRLEEEEILNLLKEKV